MCHHWTRDAADERLEEWVEEPEPDAAEREEEPAVEEREDDRDPVEVPPADD